MKSGSKLREIACVLFLYGIPISRSNRISSGVGAAVRIFLLHRLVHQLDKQK
jgi:hypothetical protein